MNNTFICKAPWVSKAFQPEGVTPCCIYALNRAEPFADNATQFSEVRQQFLTGQIPPGCDKCKTAFQQNRRGYYQSFDQYLTNFDEINVQEINIKSNNLCNLACRSCGPHFSSKWGEEFDTTINIIKDTELFDKLSVIDFSKLKHIRFAGGEPTMTSDHVQVLKELLSSGNTNVHIIIATNLHTLKYKDIDLIELWKKFPNLKLHVSIDAIDEKASSIRSGTNWNLVEKNLKLLVENQISCFINLTVSALNIWFLEETVLYFRNNFKNIQVKFSILTDPDILNLHVIPTEYRTELNKMLDRCILINADTENIKTYFNLTTTEKLWPHFLIYNLMLDITRKETFFNNLPIKQNLINRWIKL